MALTRITTGIIADNTLAVANIADNAVDATKIASNSILTRHIDDDQITGDQLADNITVAGTLASGAITSTGLLTLTGASIFLNESGNTEQYVRITNSTVTGYLGVEGSSANRFSGSTANNMFLGTTTADGIEFATNNTVRATISSAGKATFNNGASLGEASDITSSTGASALLTVHNSYSSAANNVVLIRGGANEASGKVLEVQDHAGNTDFLIDGSGKVGIGTTSPTSPLHISSATNRTLLLDYTAGSGGYTWASFKQSGTEKFRVFGDYTAGYLSFYNDTQSAHQLTLASSGKVGIGDSSPDNRLDVDFDITGEGSNEGGIKIQNSHGVNNDFAPLYFGVHGGTRRTKAAIGLKRTGSYGIGDLVFAMDANGDDANVTFANDEVMRITSAGKVGIGTDAPDTGLHLYGTSNVSSGFTIEQVYGGSSKKFGFQPVYNDDRLDIWYNSNATSAITIKDGGNVGIGDTSPITNLTVGGSVNGRVGFHIYNTDTTGNSAYAQLNLGHAQGSFSGGYISHHYDGQMKVYNRDNAAMSFATNDTERMSIDGDGRVGINNSLTDSDLSHVIPANTLVHRREGWQQNRAHYGRTLKYSEGLSWTDAVKIDWNNSSWGAVNMRIKGQGYYNPGDAFDVVIGFQSHVAHASANYSVTSNAEGTYTHFINIVRTTTGETVIQQRNSNDSSSTEDIVFLYEWVTNNRTDQVIAVVDL